MQNPIQTEVSFFAPVCEVCKAQDETLRAVSYPFVFSVILATFQRAFSGVFCAKHQRRYHLLASLITSTAGWFGIPFGFFLTPLTLFKLARGGVVHVAESVTILNQVAEKQLRTGDVTGAIRCLEESLKFQDNPEVREKLARLYGQNRSTTEVRIPEAVWQFLGVSVLLTAAIITGLVIGLLDILIIYLLSPFVGASDSIFVAILSWLPTVILLFVEVLFIRFMLRWILYKGRITSASLGTVLAVAVTCLAFYSFLEGQSLLRNLEGLLTFFSMSAKDGIFILRSVLTHGGLDVLISHFEQGLLSDMIAGMLLAGVIFLSLYAGIEMAVQATRWQKRLFPLRSPVDMETSQASVSAWLALGSIVLGMILISVLLYPGNYVNAEPLYWEVSLGMTEMDQNHYDLAIDHFSTAVDLWDASATSHMLLGIGYYSQDKYDQGMEELEISLDLDPDSLVTHLGRGYNLVRQGKHTESLAEFKYLAEAQPEWGLPHAALAVNYDTLDEVELAEQELQLALDYGKEDGPTNSIISSYYVQKLDFKTAEEYALKAIKLSNDGEDYIALARIYILENKFDQARKVIEEASRQGADPVSVYQAKVTSAETQNDLEAASAILAEALRQYPNQSDLLSENSYILFQKGQIERAAKEAEKALEINPYNATGYVEQAFAYHAQGRLNEALAAAKLGAALDPKYDRAHYILGLCYMELGRKSDARAEFETFLKLYWERPVVKEYKENVLIYLEELR